MFFLILFVIALAIPLALLAIIGIIKAIVYKPKEKSVEPVKEPEPKTSIDTKA